MGFWNYAWAVIVICAVLFAAYYVTRAVARAGGGGGGLRRGKAVRLLGSLPLARDKSVALVEIGEYVYVLGVGAQRVERLDRLPKNGLSPAAEEQSGTEFAESFRKILGGQMNKLYGKRWAFENSHEAK